MSYYLKICPKCGFHNLGKTFERCRRCGYLLKRVKKIKIELSSEEVEDEQAIGSTRRH